MIHINRLIPRIYYSFLILHFFIITNNVHVLVKFDDFKKAKTKQIIKIAGKRFFVRDLYDIFALREVFIDKVYARLFSNLCYGTTFIDLGGYIGDSAIFASDFKNIKQIIVVEPFPENQSSIKENIRLNKIKGIRVIKAAISKDIGEREFFIHPNKGQSGFNKLKNNILQIKVQTITLSGVIQLVHYNHIILKCDIEGAEYEIFMNASKKTFKMIDRIIFEYHMPQDKLEKLLNHLSKFGFNVSFEKHAVEPNLGNAFCFKR